MRMGLGLGLNAQGGGGAADAGSQVRALLSGTTGFARDPGDALTVFSDTTGAIFQTAPGSATYMSSFWGSATYNWQQATAANAPTWSGSLLDYDGNDQTAISDLTYLNAATSFLSSQRVTVDSLAANMQVYAYSTNSATQARLTLRILSTGAIEFGGRLTDGGAASLATSAAGVVQVGVPVTITCHADWSGAALWRVWANGVLVASAAITGGPGTVSATNSARARFGADLAASPGQFLDGKEVRGVFRKNFTYSDADRVKVEAWVGGAGNGLNGPLSMVATRHAITGTSRWLLGPQAYGHAGIYDASRNVSVFCWLEEPAATIIRVAELNHSTGVISAPVTVGTSPLDNDDHVQGTIELLSDGRYVIFYGGHDTAGAFAVSNSAGSIAAWTVQSALPSNSYPKPVNFGSGGGAGTIWLIFQDTPTANLDYMPITYTSLGSLSQGSVAELITSTGRAYAGPVALSPNGLEAEITWCRANTADDYRRNIYFASVDFSTSPATVYNCDRSYSQSAPVDETAAVNYLIINSGTDSVTLPQFQRDSAGNGHIVYARGSATGPFPVFHIVNTGSGWSAPEAIGTVHEYAFTSSGFCDGPSIAKFGSGVAACWPSGYQSAGGYVRGGTNLVLGEYTGGKWARRSVATPSVGVFADISPVRNATSALAFLVGERDATGATSINLPLYTVGMATTWPSYT